MSHSARPALREKIIFRESRDLNHSAQYCARKQENLLMLQESSLPVKPGGRPSILRRSGPAASSCAAAPHLHRLSLNVHRAVVSFCHLRQTLQCLEAEGHGTAGICSCSTSGTGRNSKSDV